MTSVPALKHVVRFHDGVFEPLREFPQRANDISPEAVAGNHSYLRTLTSFCRAANCAGFPVFPGYLVRRFRDGPTNLVQKAIEDEVDSIWSTIGWQFEWEPSRNTDKMRVCSNLAVIHFKGACDIEDLTVYDTYRYTLDPPPFLAEQSCRSPTSIAMAFGRS